MATNYPAAKDDGTSLPSPTGTNTQNNPDHAALHSNSNAAIIAVETKVGTGATVAAANTLLYGTGAGTSAWQGLTSAQLASILSDETGSGSAVFATTPTLVTPKVDTINENTLNNGVTVGGVNLKGGALNTNNSVVSANITNAAVTVSKLFTGAATAAVATSETTTSTTYVQLTTTTDNVTVTIGANGLALVVVSCQMFNVTAGGQPYMSFSVSGASTVAAADTSALSHKDSSTNGLVQGSYTKLLSGLTAGSNTFSAKYRTVANTATFLNREIAVVPL
jgi:hypothetical protein